MSAANSKDIGYRFVSTCSDKYSPRLFDCEARSTASRAASQRSVTTAVLPVFSWRCPPKIREVVVKFISVPMGDLMSRGGFGTMESSANHEVYSFPGATATVLQHDRLVAIEPVEVLTHLRHASKAIAALMRSSYVAARAYFVRPSWDWTPFLNLGYIMRSHIGLLRMIRGVSFTINELTSRFYPRTPCLPTHNGELCNG